MPYAEGRTYFDADSHIMELGDWLTAYLDADLRDRIGPLPVGDYRHVVDDAGDRARARRGDPDATARAEDRLLTAKGWAALGAFDPAERSRALDLLGFDRQLVFTTFSAGQFLADADAEVRWRGLRAHNRGIVDFCSHDERLMPVAMVPLTDPERAAEEVEACLADGAAAVQVLHDAPPQRSHTHPAYDGVWGRLHDARVPFVLHVGGSRRGISPSLHNNGLPRPPDLHGGGENIRSKDFMALHHKAEIFLAMMAMDGLFERFDQLRGAAIELGALWVPSLLARLDLVAHSFRRTEPELGWMALSPAEYLRRNVRFTPFPGEPVGQLVEQAGADLFLFSSDYPHPEGGRDPLGRFEATLGGASEAVRSKFYSGNFADLFGLPVPSA
jgi:predicted TIM-barrel fold metal-dependent hydrolase